MKQFRRGISFLLAVVLVLGMVYIGPVAQTHGAAASDYISASYPANLTVATTRTVGLMAYPTGSASADYTIAAGTMLTVKALHQNTSNTYWYEVLFYDMTLYVDATACVLVSHLTGDVTTTDLLTPAALGSGAGFPLTGTISSSLNKLGTITASVYKSSNIHTTPVITSSAAANSYSYTLDSSAVDNNLIFSDLPVGSYTFLLTAEAISYYINEAGALATSTQTVVLDNKPLIVSANSTSNPVIARGIDVSVHNGSIDWSSVASQVDFAILRIGWEYTLDTRFVENAAGCNKYGIPFGVYIYSYAESEAEAVAEAEFVINTLKNYDVDLPIFFDIEDECQSSLGATAIQNIVKAFCDTIREAGYEPGLYTFLSWFNSYFGGTYYNSLPKWVAQLSSTCSYSKGLTMWQYSWTGSFSGISGDVDCNYYYGEFPGKTTDTSYLSKCTYYPSNLNATVNAAVNMRQYPSTDYSILEQIGAGEQVHVTGLYKNAYGNYWYQVEKDGVTGYIDANHADAGDFRYDDLSVVNPTMSDLALNAGYYLKGKLRSVYNNMYAVNARVYSGEDTTATPVLTSSATPNAKSYTLNYSEVCDNMIFSDLDTGYYTYELSADVKNYYVSGGALASETENVVVWTAPFTVGNATIEPPAETACNHTIVTQPAVAATCTASGLTQGSYCSKCGIVFATQETVPAKGHSYTATSDGATCQDYELFHCVCSVCGHSYDVAADALSQWSETKPVGIDDSLIESATQYRYADCTSQSWQVVGTGSVKYVPTWAAGFDTGSSVYAEYNKASSKVTASETATSKTVIDSDTRIGYLWYHWCSTSVTSSWATKTDTYTTFHTYFGTTSPDNYSCDTSDYSYKTAHSSCSNSSWWFPMDVWEQTYTQYQMAPDGVSWSDWSAWSDTVYTAVENSRKVESRTVYRYIGAELAPHSWVGGFCSACGAECDHNYGIDGVCTVCGESDVCKHTSHDVNGICASCGNAVGHYYQDQVCTVCGKTLTVPSISPTAASVSFENEILMNIYFTASDLDNADPANMGLITWTSPQSAGTIEMAQSVVPGAIVSGSEFRVSTAGIAAKKLGDAIYCKIYIKLDDGSFVYSNLLTVSPKAYALGRIAKSSSTRMKALCVAMLNYGAAAQTYFGYKPYDLMNAGLTDAQKALVQSYSESMVDALPTVDSTKAADFTFNSGFKTLSRAVSFEGAFAVNYYLSPSYTPQKGMTLYYWSADSYASLSRLTKQNADRVITMSDLGTGEFMATIEGIAAKEVNEVFYVAATYENGGITYATGVLAYSLGRYCANQAAKTTTMRDLAAHTAVYSCYARDYFANL